MSEQNYSYIFRCTDKTEQECLRKLLFGEKAKHASWVKTIKKGDPVFLYNVDSNLLSGVYIAATDGGENLDPGAWKGGFPYQVKIEPIKDITYLPKSLIESFVKFYFVYGKSHPEPRLDVYTVNKLKEIFLSDGKKEVLPRKELSKGKIKTKDGHIVRSIWEERVDDWLTEKSLLHYYEKSLNIEEQLLSDFYIPHNLYIGNQDFYIELWGKKDEKYLKRKAKKIALYKKYNINLVEIFPQDLDNLDESLPPKLKEYGIDLL